MHGRDDAAAYAVKRIGKDRAVITVLCCNAGIDRTYAVDSFQLGGYHVPRRMRAAPGGKGVNVSRVLRVFGENVVIGGFAGGVAADFISTQLKRGGMTPGFVRIAEESRLCINIVDTSTRSQTQVDEPGPLVTPSEVDTLMRRWPSLLDRSSLAILSGSAPRGAPFSLYHDLIQQAHALKVPVILDARDEMLANAIAARPQVIKPNFAELCTLMGAELAVPNGIVEASRELWGKGINTVITSLGHQGAIFASRTEGLFWALPPKIDVVSPVGSGDALVAGYAAALVHQRSYEERMRWAIAAGAANAASFGAGDCTAEQIRNISSEVTVKDLDTRDDLTPAAQSDGGPPESP
jgi:tagatose 6-phosphate kinase